MLVPGKTLHELEGVGSRPAQEAVVRRRTLAGIAVGLEVETPPVVGQLGHGKLGPTRVVLDREIDVFGRARVELVAPHQGTVPIQGEGRFLILLDHLGNMVDIRNQVEAATARNVEPKEVVEVGIFRDGARSDPGSSRIGPETLDDGDAVHRLALQNPLDAFATGQFLHGIIPRW